MSTRDQVKELMAQGKDTAEISAEIGKSEARDWWSDCQNRKAVQNETDRCR